MKQHVFLPILTALILTCSGYNNVIIVKNNNPNAVIVLPEDASEHIRLAADILAGYINKSTGATLPVVTNPPERDIVSIHVCEGDLVGSYGLDIGDMDADGFIIAVPDHKTVVIAGPTG